VTATEAHLYAQQDSESKVVMTLLKGNVLKPLAQIVGTGVWYMVRTSKGAVGWIQAVDVASTQRTDEVFRDSLKTNPKDVTPEAQTEANKENSKREARESAGVRPSDWRVFTENRGEPDRQFVLIGLSSRIPPAAHSPEPSAVVCGYTPPR
jgi:hypothetical protein